MTRKLSDTNSDAPPNNQDKPKEADDDDLNERLEDSLDRPPITQPNPLATLMQNLAASRSTATD